MEANLVWTWLRSLQLESYTQAFLDNGYDDLEVCKQIGHPDLDAIGVDSGENRDTLLAAVQRLAEQGGTDVYFLLEDPDYQDQKRRAYDDCYEAVNWCRYPHTRVLLGEPVTSDEKDDCALAKTSRRGDKIGHGCRLPSDLAEKYAVELGTSKEDVLDQLKHLGYCTERQQQCNGASTSDHIQTTSQPLYSFYAVHEDGATEKPLLSRPSLTMTYCHARDFFPESVLTPASSVSDLPTCSVLGDRVEKSPRDGLVHEVDDRKALQRELPSEVTKRTSNTLSRLLRRPAGKKYTYRQFEGDLNASDITMSEQDRIELMLLVKKGKISPEEAVEMVKKYEQVKAEPFLPSTSHDVDSNLKLHSAIEDDLCDEDNPCVSNGSTPVNSSQPCPLVSRFNSSQSPLLHTSASQGMMSVRPDSPKTAKPSKFIRSPFSSPTKRPSSVKATQLCDAGVPLAKDKRKFSFSSPFARRKASTSVKGQGDQSTSFHGNSPKRQPPQSGVVDSDDVQKQGRRRKKDGVEKHQGNLCTKHTASLHSGKTSHPCSACNSMQNLSYTPPSVDTFSVGSQTLRRHIEPPERTAGCSTTKQVACRSVSPSSHHGMISEAHLQLRKIASQELRRSPPSDQRMHHSPPGDQSSHHSINTSPAQASSDTDITPLGSSSTMSVGSESSPVMNTRKEMSRATRRPKMAYRRFSAGDCIFSSSDYDEDSSHSSIPTDIITPSHIEDARGSVSSDLTRRKFRGHARRHRAKHRTVEELLCRLSLQHLLAIFIRAGCDTLQAFSELEKRHLDELGITNAEDRAKVITAAQMLLDYDEESTDSTDVYSRASSSSQSPAAISSCDSAPHLTRDRTRILLHRDDKTEIDETNVDDSTLTASDKGIQNGCYYPDDVSTLTDRNQINGCSSCLCECAQDGIGGAIVRSVHETSMAVQHKRHP